MLCTTQLLETQGKCYYHSIGRINTPTAHDSNQSPKVAARRATTRPRRPTREEEENNKKFMDAVRKDMRVLGVTVEDGGDRVMCRQVIPCGDPSCEQPRGVIFIYVSKLYLLLAMDFCYT